MRRIAGLLVGIGAVVVAACGASVTEPVDLTLRTTDATVAGTFNLLSVNGGDLPTFSFSTQSADWLLLTEKFTINSDNSWVDSSHYQLQFVASGNVTDTLLSTSGTYSVANGRINFTTTVGGNDAFPGSVTGSVLTVIFGNQRWVYSR